MVLTKKECKEMKQYEILLNILKLDIQRFHQWLLHITHITQTVEDKEVTLINCYLMDSRKLNCERFKLVNDSECLQGFIGGIRKDYPNVPITNLNERGDIHDNSRAN